MAQPVSAAGLHSVAQYLVTFWAQILHQIAVVVVAPERRQHDSSTVLFDLKYVKQLTPSAVL